MAGALSPLWLVSACAKPPETPSAFAPEFGHSQPLPTEPSGEGANANTEPHQDASDDEPSEPPALPTAEEETLCSHIVGLVQSESKDPATADQTAELLTSCALALAHDRRRLGEEEFGRRAACISAATTVADFSACAPGSD